MPYALIPLMISTAADDLHPKYERAIAQHGDTAVLDEMYWQDFQEKEQKCVNVALNMPEERRLAYLCKTITWRQHIYDDWPQEGPMITASQITWFEPKVRVQLLESLSPKNELGQSLFKRQSRIIITRV